MGSLQAAKRDLPPQLDLACQDNFFILTADCMQLHLPTDSHHSCFLAKRPHPREGWTGTYIHIGMGHLAETTAVGITQMRGEVVDVVTRR